VDPKLDFGDINKVVELSERCTRLPVHARHPYAGELVFTAFSGSHQDAIRKGLAANERTAGQGDPGSVSWEVPYLPIDPADVGRDYEAVIRINSQSGKGGLAFVMERDHGFVLPRALQIEFSKQVQQRANASGEEVSSKEVGEIFRREYLDAHGPFELTEISWERGSSSQEGCRVVASVSSGGESRALDGTGSGPVHAFVAALSNAFEVELEVRDYSEHALGSGADARAVAYVELVCETETGTASCFGVATDESIVVAPIRALLAGFNRLIKDGGIASIA
jgi:2-isopropylmalate synthase